MKRERRGRSTAADFIGAVVALLDAVAHAALVDALPVQTPELAHHALTVRCAQKQNNAMRKPLQALNRSSIYA